VATCGKRRAKRDSGKRAAACGGALREAPPGQRPGGCGTPYAPRSRYRFPRSHQGRRQRWPATSRRWCAARRYRRFPQVAFGDRFPQPRFPRRFPQRPWR